MKKFLVFLLTLALIFTLAACGEKEDNVLTMATEATFPPYEFYEGDQVVGIDAEIAALIADKLGMELKIEDMAFDSIVPSLTEGRADIGMAAMSATEERALSANFTDTYATGVLVAVVKEGGPITDVDQLFEPGGYTIGAQTGTTGEIYATLDIEEAGLGTVERFNKYPDAIQALLTGKIDCVIVDSDPAKSYVEANEGLVILDEAFSNEDYVICIAKDNDELLEKVNTALRELIADGSVQAVIDKYISE